MEGQTVNFIWVNEKGVPLDWSESDAASFESPKQKAQIESDTLLELAYIRKFLLEHTHLVIDRLVKKVTFIPEELKEIKRIVDMDIKTNE